MDGKNIPKLPGQKPFKFLFTSFRSSVLGKLKPTTQKSRKKAEKELYLHDSFKEKKEIRKQRE